MVSEITQDAVNAISIRQDHKCFSSFKVLSGGLPFPLSLYIWLVIYCIISV